MTAQTILPANTLSSGFDVANSVRFDTNAYMHKTPGSAGTLTTWTLSTWIKRSKLGATQYIFTSKNDGNNQTFAYFNSNDTIIFFDTDGNADQGKLITDRLFRDVGAWYHLVFIWNTTDGTAGDRIQLWVNGVRETSFSTQTNPDQNDASTMGDAHIIEVGRGGEDSNYANFYMAQTVYQNGSAASPVDVFGEFDSDSGIWKPINVSGLTFGTNGFYLDFEASGNLGNDANGGTDLTEVNVAATDQSTDTCTNNFCTWNPIANYTNSVAFSEGNLIAMSGANDRWDSGRASMGFAKGKWYFECLFVAGVSTQYIGVTDESAKFNTANAHDEDGVTVFYNNSGGEIRKDGTATTADYGTFSSSEVAGIAIDADNFTISVYKGGSLIVDAYDLSTTRTGFLFPFTTNLNNGDGVKVNFGSPLYSESGGNTDANGYGNFNQSVPSGYFAINTKNLAEHG